MERATRLALTTAEAAEEIGVPVRTLTTWRCQGTGPPFAKLGTAGPTSPVRYPVDLLVEWLRERARLSTSDNGKPERGVRL